MINFAMCENVSIGEIIIILEGVGGGEEDGKIVPSGNNGFQTRH